MSTQIGHNGDKDFWIFIVVMVIILGAMAVTL